jgi:hypothetical protein
MARIASERRSARFFSIASPSDTTTKSSMAPIASTAITERSLLDSFTWGGPLLAT